MVRKLRDFRPSRKLRIRLQRCEWKFRIMENSNLSSYFYTESKVFLSSKTVVVVFRFRLKIPPDFKMKRQVQPTV